jgi:hypothetical protein
MGQGGPNIGPGQQGMGQGPPGNYNHYTPQMMQVSCVRSNVEAIIYLGFLEFFIGTVHVN